MQAVDPLLKNNRGLVERLTKWAECWEAAARYLLPSDMRDSMDILVDGLRRAGQISLEFAQMCESQDAEMFLVLPRLVWLLNFENEDRVAPILDYIVPGYEDEDYDELADLCDAFYNIAASLKQEVESKDDPDATVMGP